jgi:hypothetical protein
MRYIIFLIIGLTSLAGCSRQSTETLHTEDQKVPQYQNDIAAASSRIRDTPEFESCMQPYVNMCIKDVGVRFAQEKKDITLCDELSAADDKENCRFVITLLTATESKDAKTCNTLT